MERNLAVLIDFENIATGCEKEGLGRFDPRIVMRRLKDKGRILVSRAYADWGRWSRFKLDLVHEGCTMVELTAHGMQSKNRADIALAVDAMELAYTREYVDTFVVLSGDSDFTPLVMRLKELNKRVIGCGTRGSTSRLIAETCDEFLFYDTLLQETRPPRPTAPPKHEEEEKEPRLTLDAAFELLEETLENQQRDDPKPVHAGVLKTSMKRKAPTFDEGDLGVRTFARFLEAAAKRGLVKIIPDPRAGGYLVDLPGNDEVREASSVVDDVGRLVEALVKDGLDIGSAAERRVLLQSFVSECHARAAAGKKLTGDALLSALPRALRDANLEVSARLARGVVRGLLKAGALTNPDGRPVTTNAAFFVAPDSASELERALAAHALGALEARGLVPGDAAFEVLFGAGAPAEDPPREEPHPQEPTPAEAPVEKKRSRRGGRRGKKAEAEPVEYEEPPF